MTFLLDTNVCIGWLNGETTIRDKLLALQPQDVCTSSIVRAELTFGALASGRPAANLRKLSALWADLRCIPVGDEVADEYGAIRSELKRAGTPIGPNDLFIAATARAHRLRVVTRNYREYTQVPGLAIERW